MISLRSKVRDSITGFTGIATARCEYLDASPAVRVERQAETPLGERADDFEPLWFDEGRLEAVG